MLGKPGTCLGASTVRTRLTIEGHTCQNINKNILAVNDKDRREHVHRHLKYGCKDAQEDFPEKFIDAWFLKNICSCIPSFEQNKGVKKMQFV